MGLVDKINKLQSLSSDMKALEVRAEERLLALQNRMAEIGQQLVDLGVDPDNLDSSVESLDAELLGLTEVATTTMTGARDVMKDLLDGKKVEDDRVSEVLENMKKWSSKLTPLLSEASGEEVELSEYTEDEIDLL